MDDIARVVDPAGIAFTQHERTRCDLLADPLDRRAFAAAHALVRHCAAQLAGLDVHDVVLDQRCPTCGADGHGRPSVRLHDDVSAARVLDGVHVSLAHTRTHVAAVAARVPCGIDLEARAASIPARALTPRERAWVATQADAELAFTRLWVRKEALVKAGGADLAATATTDVLDRDAPASRYLAFDLDELAPVTDRAGRTIIACTARARV